MTLEQSIEQELAFFSGYSHPQSFELISGEGVVMLSAPHAVLQTREGALKCAERYTGVLCRLAHERIGCPVVYKTRHMNDDANFDPVSEYRDALCAHVKSRSIRCVLDLHQMKPERSVGLCIGTGQGHNLAGQRQVVDTVVQCMGEHGITNIAIDMPFSASRMSTVSATVAAYCGIPALQVEMNTRLLMREYEEFCFSDILDALCDLTERLARE